MKKIFVICFALSPIASSAQEEQKLFEQVETQLSNGSKSISDILTDPTYMKLHSLTNFRTIIKKNAKQEKVSIASKKEPGTVATIKGKLTANYPVADLLIYVYQTDNKGWYADTGGHVLAREGDRGHARLFGYLRSDKDGRFEFTTIHPQGYPKSDLPQHIHLEVFDKGGTSLIITELLFDDDSRLVGETRSASLRNGFLVAKNQGNAGMQVYSYTVSLR